MAQEQDRSSENIPPLPPSPRSTTAPGQMSSPQQFVHEAALSGLKEIRLGQIALQRAQDSEVKQFAQHMVQDHAAANQKLTQLARSKGFTIPSTNTFSAGATGDREYVRERDTSRPGDRPSSDTVPATPGAPGTPNRQPGRERQGQGQTPQQEMQSIQKLQSLSGTEFDRAYINETVKDHAKAVQKFENASQSLSDQELKQFASETLPKLQEHHQMAQQLAARLGNSQGQGTEDSQQRQGTPQTQPQK